MEVNVKFNFVKTGKKFFLAMVIFFIALGLFWISRQKSVAGTIPSVIKQQASFKTVSAPSDYQPQNYAYINDQKTVTFNIKYQGKDLTVSEQLAPENLVSGTGVYFQSLGLHPIAQFDSKCGPVAILNFYKTVSLEPAGQSGLLVADKTMVTVSFTNNNQKFSNEQWKQLFDSFKLN